MDSLSKEMNFQWKSKESLPHKMIKACCMMAPEECTKKDSVCAPDDAWRSQRRKKYSTYQDR